MKGIDAWRLLSPLIAQYLANDEMIEAYVLVYRALTRFDEQMREVDDEN